MTTKSNKGISISGTLTYAEYKKSNWYHIRKIVFGGFVIVFLCLIMTFFDLISDSLIFVTILSFITSGMISLLLVLFLFIRVRNEFKSDNINNSKVSYEMDNKGINKKVRRSNSYIDWSDIFVAKEDKDMFRLYISKNKAIVLPKRFFNSKEEINFFKTLIERNLNTNKIKMSSRPE